MFHCVFLTTALPGHLRSDKARSSWSWLLWRGHDVRAVCFWVLYSWPFTNLLQCQVNWSRKGQRARVQGSNPDLPIWALWALWTYIQLLALGTNVVGLPKVAIWASKSQHRRDCAVRTNRCIWTSGWSTFSGVRHLVWRVTLAGRRHLAEVQV